MASLGTAIAGPTARGPTTGGTPARGVVVDGTARGRVRAYAGRAPRGRAKDGTGLAPFATPRRHPDRRGRAERRRHDRPTGAVERPGATEPRRQPRQASGADRRGSRERVRHHRHGGPIGRLLWAYALGLAAVLLAAGCGAGPSGASGAGTSAPRDAGPGATGTASAPRIGPTPAASATSEFNGTDLAWLQLMTAMNERMLPVLDMAAERASDPALRRFARDARAGHRAELARLRRLLAHTGLTGANPHEGHDMPGMVTAEQLAAMRRAAGADFDRRVAAGVRAHVDQCTRLARSERQSGASADVRALARDIERARAEQGRLLDRLS